MNVKKTIKNVSLMLIFLLTGLTGYFASSSFAKYLEQAQSEASAGMAKPIVNIQNGWLYRTDIYGVEFEYDVTNQDDGEISFYDIEPNDQIDFFFSVNNYIISGGGVSLNEVKMKYTLIVSVHLKRLTTEGEIEEYYVVGNRFLVSDDADEQKDMDGSNFSFYYSKSGALVNDSGEYTNVAIDKETDKINSMADLAESFYTNNLDSKVTKELKYIDNKAEEFPHYFGSIFNATDGAIQHPYLLRITLPEQKTTGTQYASGRLFIHLELIAEQMM